jgi:hypothetical protein
LYNFNIGTKNIDESYESSGELATASLPYVCDPTEPCHDYAKIPETQSNKSMIEQVVKFSQLDSNCHPIVALPYLEVEDHTYVIPAIVSLPFRSDIAAIRENLCFAKTMEAM